MAVRDQLARLAQADIVQRSGADDADRHAGDWPADGADALLQAVVAGGLRDDGGRFGQAVANCQLARPHAIDDGAHHLDRAWAAGHHAGAQVR